MRFAPTLTGGMDVSDGLAGDLTKMCRASNVSAEIDVARVPLSVAARVSLAADAALIEQILTGGDDYENPWQRCRRRGANAFMAAAKARGRSGCRYRRCNIGQGRAEIRVEWPSA